MARKKRRSRASKDIGLPKETGQQKADDVKADAQSTAKPKDEPKPKAKAQPAKTASKNPSAGKRMGSFLKDVRAEMKKVAWPDKERTAQSTGIVIFTLFALALCMAFFTMIFTRVATILFS